MPKEPPGPRALQEFIESLRSIEGVDPHVADALATLHAKGPLKSSAIVSALRGARKRVKTDDENSQA